MVQGKISMKLIVHTCTHKCLRLPRQLHVSMQYSCFLQGLGTDDQDLIRIIVSRCEVDLVDIKLEFQRKYHKTLGSFIKVINDHNDLLLVDLSVSHSY